MPELSADERRRLAFVARDAFAALRTAVSGQLEAAYFRSVNGLDDVALERLVVATQDVLVPAASTTQQMVGGVAQLELGAAAPVLPAVDYADDARRWAEEAMIRARTASSAATAAELSPSQVLQAATRAGVDRLVRGGTKGLAEVQRDGYSTVVGESDQVVGRIRVPEGETCGFCVAAASRVYGPAELEHMHARCDCGQQWTYSRAEGSALVEPYKAAYDSELTAVQQDAADKALAADATSDSARATRSALSNVRLTI